MQIRLAKTEDSAGLAKVQVDSYQIGYRGLLPDAFLDQFTYEEQTQDWIELLSESQTEPLYVAVDSENQVLGYALGRTLENEKYDCELRAVHVLKAHQRQGIATALFSATAKHYADIGCQSIMLWTMKKNSARAMYEKLGGKLVDEKTDTWDDGTQITEVAYGWENIQDLIRDSE